MQDALYSHDFLLLRLPFAGGDLPARLDACGGDEATASTACLIGRDDAPPTASATSIASDSATDCSAGAACFADFCGDGGDSAGSWSRARADT